MLSNLLLCVLVSYVLCLDVSMVGLCCLWVC